MEGGRDEEGEGEGNERDGRGWIRKTERERDDERERGALVGAGSR